VAGRRKEGGKGRDRRKGGEMTQTLYAHMNKRKNFKKKETFACALNLFPSLMTPSPQVPPLQGNTPLCSHWTCVSNAMTFPPEILTEKVQLMASPGDQALKMHTELSFQLYLGKKS
jgi:hypothetical protein